MKSLANNAKLEPLSIFLLLRYIIDRYYVAADSLPDIRYSLSISKNDPQSAEFAAVDISCVFGP